MNFCETCSGNLLRLTASGKVCFQCPSCNVITPGKPEDARIYSKCNNNADTLRRYANLVKNAPFDPVNQRVLKKCVCGLDYMVQMRLSDAEVVVWKCKCGNEISGK